MTNRKVILLILLISFLFSFCSEKIVPLNETTITDTTSLKSQILKTKQDEVEIDTVKLGIDILEERNFDILRNKRIGLITNQTGVNSSLKSTIDILNESKNVNLVALFGPEHGVRGEVEGGKYVEFYTDPKTNLPVYSLYGKTRKPSEEMLKGIDILVYDIQDIGVRSYTFISTMGLAIEAAAENDIEFIVLDRPNPLGGIKVEGNIVEPEFISFIGQFPIPYVYGLTCGELAKLLVGEKMINTTETFNLSVVPMENWKRSMTWEDTNLEWIPTSPHIPHYFTSFYYPMTGILGELRSAISIGVGYTLPFQLVGAEWLDGNNLANKLNDMNIPGLIFRSQTFRPYYAFGEGKTLNGIQIHIVDYEKVNLTYTQFYILHAIKELHPDKDLFSMATKNEVKMFNKGIGTDKISRIDFSKKTINEILSILDTQILSFKDRSVMYFLY